MLYPLLVAKLQAAGVDVAPGSVEVFPRPTKPGARRALLRVPFVAFRWVADAEITCEQYTGEDFARVAAALCEARASLCGR